MAFTDNFGKPQWVYWMYDALGDEYGAFSVVKVGIYFI